MLKVAEITKPQGIRGEIKANPLFDVPTDFLRLKEVVIDGRVYTVERARVDGNAVVAKLGGVETRNEAELFRGKDMYCPREKMPRLPEGRVYVAELIGCTVRSKAKEYGVLTDVLQHGAADVYVVEGARNFMFPAVDGVLISLSPATKTVEVDEKALEEVAVYED